MGCGSSSAAAKEEEHVSEGHRSTDEETDDAPFSGYESRLLEPDTNGSKRQRSKSVAVLQKISEQRVREEEAEESQGGVFEDFQPQPLDTDRSESDSNDGSVASRRSTHVRQRRLSSIYNEFAGQVHAFLKKGNESEGEEDDTEGSEEEENRDSKEYIENIFKLIDIDKKGFITLANLEAGFKKMGFESQTKIDEMFSLASRNSRDDRLEWDEFYKFFKHLKHCDLNDGDNRDEEQEMRKSKLVRRSRTKSMMFVSIYSYRIEAYGSVKGRVKCVAVSPYRKLVAACSRDDKSIKLFDFCGNVVRILNGHKDSMLGIAFSPDKKHLATASRDCTMNVWDATVGHELGVVQHPGVVTCVAYSYDGKFLYSGCQDNVVRKFTGSKCRFLSAMNRLPKSELGVVVALATQAHANDTIVMSRSCDKGAIALDASSLAVLYLLEGHETMVWQIQFNHEGNRLVTTCEKLVKVWDTMSLTCLVSIRSDSLSPHSPIKTSRPKLWTTVCFCPPSSGPLIAIVNTDTNIFIVHQDTGALILNFNLKSSAYSIAAAVEHPFLITGDDWGNLYRIHLN